MTLNIQYWVLQTIAMMLTALLIPKLRVRGPLGAFLMVVALSYVNSHFWDAALFFKLPKIFSLQALILLFVNGIIFWVLVKLLPWIEVDGVLAAIAAPIVFTVLSLLINEYGPLINWFDLSKELFNIISNFLSGVKSTLQDVPTANKVGS